MDAAAAVFAEHGFDAATTREVAERAGCSEGLIHRNFGGKRGLLLALLESRARATEDAYTPPADRDLVGVVRTILVGQIDAMWERRDIMRVNVSQACIDTEVGELVARRLNEVRVAQITDVLSALQEAGQISGSADIYAVAHSLAGLGFALGFWAQVVFAQGRDAVVARAEEFARVVAIGLAPESAPQTAAGDQP
jgi:AcrR family transcriptional regulator